ncbi:MAG: phosphate/phosphite/phosphonate ABC transporter substrate-binding protein [Betaproteobacteria bacterium]|nr:phosphate/phosphite/phosphonate ABC transporter substrate-binding protein [Betaproteobacteria bacterium]
MPAAWPAVLLALAVLPALPAVAAPAACSQRGELDALYCDANGDLIADAPTDPKRLRTPTTLLMSYSPQEDAVVYERLWQPYLTHLAQCTGKRVKFFQVHSSAASIEAMRSGRVQLGLVSAGDTPFSVNVGGMVPFAIHGTVKDGLVAYRLIVVVRADSPYKALADLKGRKIAHVSPSSNSGNLAPRALFPAAGLVPDKDYTVAYSGKHDNSIMGVLNKDYDAGAIADDVLTRMEQRGVVKAGAFRTLFTSPPFPAGSLSYAHDLDPALAGKIRECTFGFRFPAELSGAFRGADRFVPLDYRKDFEPVRRVAAASGEVHTRAGFEARKAREQPQAGK